MEAGTVALFAYIEPGHEIVYSDINRIQGRLVAWNFAAPEKSGAYTLAWYDVYRVDAAAGPFYGVSTDTVAFTVQ
jgi:hypothetical protein